MGYNCNMACIIHKGPYHYGGAAITSIVDIQGIEQIKNFLPHIQAPGNARTLLHITYRWAQHQTGWHLPILEAVDDYLPHFEARWLKSLRDYLNKIQASIKIHLNPVYPLQQ
eukprot:1224128-Ditylum_brightwellii.AAC.1